MKYLFPLLFAITAIAGPLKLHDGSRKLYGIACDPLNGIYHEIDPEPSQYVATGLPVIVYAATKAEAYAMLFSAYTLDEDGRLDTYTARPITYSTGYTKAEADETVADAVEIIDGLKMAPKKHPTRDEYAVIFSTHIFSSAKAGAKRDKLTAKHIKQVKDGKTKTKAQADADGWK